MIFETVQFEKINKLIEFFYNLENQNLAGNWQILELFVHICPLIEINFDALILLHTKSALKQI